MPHSGYCPTVWLMLTHFRSRKVLGAHFCAMAKTMQNAMVFLRGAHFVAMQVGPHCGPQLAPNVVPRFGKPEFEMGGRALDFGSAVSNCLSIQKSPLAPLLVISVANRKTKPPVNVGYAGCRCGGVCRTMHAQPRTAQRISNIDRRLCLSIPHWPVAFFLLR